MVFTHPDEFNREKLVLRHNYKDRELDNLNRLYDHQLKEELLKVFKPHPNKSHNRYGVGTPEEHFQMIENGTKRGLELADGHFVAKLFVRVYQIPIVYVSINLTGFHDEENEDYDLSSKNEDIQPWFNFYFYSIDRPDPKYRQYNNFPISVLKRYNYFIICQELFYVDPDDPDKKAKYYKNNEGDHVMHHKFLVTRYKPTKESTEETTADLTDTDEEESVVSVASSMSSINIPYECGVSIFPGLVIEYYAPGMMTTPEFLIKTIVTETTPENSNRPVRVSNDFAWLQIIRWFILVGYER